MCELMCELSVPVTELGEEMWDLLPQPLQCQHTRLQIYFLSAHSCGITSARGVGQTCGRGFVFF